MIRYSLVFLFLLSSCGYRFEGPGLSEEVTTLSIPYVSGDVDGIITDALVRAFAGSGAYRYLTTGGALELRIHVTGGGNERIGWKYQRSTTGELQHELIATEARRSMSADITLVEGSTGEIVYGPTTVHAYVDYDYYEPDSIQDLSFINTFGVRQTSVNFSRGQLDSSEGAYDSSLTPLSRQLAKKIVDRILHARY